MKKIFLHESAKVGFLNKPAPITSLLTPPEKLFFKFTNDRLFLRGKSALTKQLQVNNMFMMFVF